MTFVPAVYQAEMRSLVTAAIRAWRALELPARKPIFTVSIWTDPNAAASAVSIDTRENSDCQVREVNEYNQRQHDRLVQEGDFEMAAHFEDRATRNCNPADFAFREIASCRHDCFPENWEDKSVGACWDQLEPALATVAAWACSEFQQLDLEPEAELAVNSRRDWYDNTWRLRA